jgi:hypothetical protein
MPSSSAASSTESPPKYRSWTSRAARGVLGGEPLQGVIDGQDFVVVGQEARISIRQINAVATAAVLAAGILDENAAHGLGSGREEMAAAVPVLRLLHIHQPDIRLVNQSGCLESLPGFFLNDFLRRQPPQLVVNERQELFGSVRVALVNGGQDIRDRAHHQSPGPDSKLAAKSIRACGRKHAFSGRENRLKRGTTCPRARASVGRSFSLIP